MDGKKKISLWEAYLTREIGIEFKACLYFFAILFFYCVYRLINGSREAGILEMAEMIVTCYIIGYIQVYVFGNFDEAENRWIMFGKPSISKKNAKFNKALQVSPGNYVIAEDLIFGGADFTVDFWGYMDSFCSPNGVFFLANSLNQQGLIHFVRFLSTDDVWITVFDANSGSIFKEPVQIIPNADPIDKLHHYEMDYNHSAQNLKVFVDGELKLEKDSVNIERLVRNVWLGNAIVYGAHYPCSGAISEFRISDCVRHDSDFTPPTEKYEIDEHTLSLLHFD